MKSGKLGKKDEESERLAMNQKTLETQQGRREFDSLTRKGKLWRPSKAEENLTYWLEKENAL